MSQSTHADLYRQLIDTLEGVNEGSGLTDQQRFTLARAIAVDLRGRFGRTAGPPDHVAGLCPTHGVPEGTCWMHQRSAREVAPPSRATLERCAREAYDRGWGDGYRNMNLHDGREAGIAAAVAAATRGQA